MSESVDVELDPVHASMVEEMTSDSTDVEEFATSLLEQSIYKAYQEYKQRQQ